MQAEIDAVDELGYDSLKSLEYTTSVVMEALRYGIHPVVVVGLTLAAILQPVSFCAQGWQVRGP